MFYELLKLFYSVTNYKELIYVKVCEIGGQYICQELIFSFFH